MSDVCMYTGLARGSASLFGLLGASVFPYLKNKIGIYVCMHVCIYICMYVCMYMYIICMCVYDSKG